MSILIFLAAASGSLKTSSVLEMLYPRPSYDARRMLARDAALARSSLSAGGIPLAGDSMTYGEFDLDFLGSLLEAAGPQKGDTFVDLGSGSGRRARRRRGRAFSGLRRRGGPARGDARGPRDLV